MDRELRKSRDATHLATDGPAPRRYDGRTTAARVRAAVFVRSENSNALIGGGFPHQSVSHSANLDSAFGVACSSLRQKPGEQLLCCSHTLHSWGTAYCAAATAVTVSDGLALTGPHASVTLVLRLV